MTEPSVDRTKVALPSGSTDCHMHIYGDPEVYPVNRDSPFRPVPGGDIDAYLRLQKALGLQRAVVVQPSAYGTDNRCTMDALERLGGNGRAVVVIDESMTLAGQRELHDKGARGIRFFMLKGGVLGWGSLETMARRAAEFGWHIQLQMDGRLLHEREAELLRLPCTLVIDHNGKFLEPVALDHPGAAALFRLLDSGRVWVKTSGVYETSRRGPPAYEDVSVLARALIDNFPERCVWATNWPHPSKPDSPPDDKQLLDLALGWCGSEQRAQQIFVDNPGRLYEFESERGTT
jgi:D-galactarolactone isomerase